MRSSFLSASCIALGLACSGYLVGHGFIEAAKPMRSVEVKGLAEKIVTANQGEWHIRYRVINNELPGLYKAIEQSEQKIKMLLQEANFEQNEMITQPQTLTDNQGNAYNTNANTPRYVADGEITVASDKVDNILTTHQKLGKLVKQGVVVTGSHTVFRYTKLNEVKPQMLLEATTNAREAAETFATQSKSKLGNIQKAHQGLFTITDANSNYNSGNDVYKRLRVVNTVTFSLR